MEQITDELIADIAERLRSRQGVFQFSGDAFGIPVSLGDHSFNLYFSGLELRAHSGGLALNHCVRGKLKKSIADIEKHEGERIANITREVC